MARQGEPATVSRAGGAVEFLRGLVLAARNLQLYPDTNPAVTGALDAAVSELETLTTTGPLTLAVRRDALLIDGEPVADPDGRFERLARDLYQRAVGTVTFAAGAGPDQLRVFLQVVTSRIEELLGTGGPAAQPAMAQAPAIVIEHNDGVEIVAGGAHAGRPERLMELAESVPAAQRPAAPAGPTRAFLRIEEGDPERLAKVEALLRTPEELSLVFQDFALHVREEAGPSAGIMVNQLLQLIETAGDVIRDTETDASRQALFKGLADAVCGLESDVRDPLVVQGLLPQASERGLEAQVLRVLPVPDLAHAFVQSVVMDPGVASMLADAIEGLDLEPDDTELLAALVQSRLETAGALSPAAEEALSDGVLSRLPGEARGPISGRERILVLLPEDSDVDPAAVPWHGLEYRKLRQEARLEALKTEDLHLLALLTNLLSVEQRAADLFALMGQARHLLATFLDKGLYVQATQLAEVVLTHRDEWAGDLTTRERARLDRILEALVDDKVVARALRDFDAAEASSLAARQILEYFQTLGVPLVERLLDRLETEETRHMRLLLCGLIAQLAAGQVDLIARRLENPAWYVARNLLTIVDKMGTEDAVPLARRALIHPEPRVVREAMKTLANLRSPEAVQAIASALQLPALEARKAAATWLGIIGDPLVVPELASVLARDPYQQDQGFILAVIDALGRIGTRQAREALDPLAARGSWFGRRRRAPIREAAREALALPEKTFAYA